MSDLSAPANLRYRFPALIQRTENYPLNGGTALSIYRGTPLIIDGNVDTIDAVKFDSGVTIATGDVFLGIVEDNQIDVLAADADGDKKATIIRRGLVGFVNSFSFTRADIGKAVYFSDSGTLTTTAGTNLGPVGEIWDVEDGYVYIDLDGGAIQA